MKQLTMALAVAGVLVCVNARPACAQGPYVAPMVNPYGRPTVSPYINLGRGGSAGINYYGLVRPQLQANAAMQLLQRNQLLEAQDLSLLATSPTAGPITGTSAQFMNFSHYYGGRIANSAVMRPAIVPPANIPIR